jgi:hypothetical protein
MVAIGDNESMRKVEVFIVSGLEVTCRSTRHLEWIPGWNRIYHCELAKWSNQLDKRWSTGRWSTHAAAGLEGWDDWEQWYESLSDEERERTHWHVFL